MSKRPRCWNRPPFKKYVKVRDGWKTVGVRGLMITVPIFKVIPNRMSKECMQWSEGGSALIENWDCSGCMWYSGALKVAGICGDCAGGKCTMNCSRSDDNAKR